jgi:hypothetical protein
MESPANRPKKLMTPTVRNNGARWDVVSPHPLRDRVQYAKVHGMGAVRSNVSRRPL